MTFEDFKKNIVKEYKEFLGYYKNPKNWDFAKIGEMSLFWFLIIILGFLSYFLLTVLKIIIPSNFNSNLINPLLALVLVIGLLLFELFFIFSKKNGNISPYFLAISFIIVAVLPSTSIITKTLIIGCVFLLSLPSMYYNWIKVKWPVIITIFLIFSFLIVSLLFVANEFGNDDITILFNNCDGSGKIDVNMKCSNILGKSFISGYETTCLTDKVLNNLTGEIVFIYANGSQSEAVNFTDSIKFVPHENTESIHQKMQAYDEGGSMLCMDTVWNKHFSTYQEYRESRNNFIYYFILIFGAAFYTIPLLVKELWSFLKKTDSN